MEGVWAIRTEQVLKEFSVNANHGLSEAEARRRLASHGPNELTSQDTPSLFRVIARQFASPLVYILVIAAAISFWQGQLTETIVVAGVIIVNAAIGAFEEYRSEMTIAKLRQLLSPQAKVLREGSRRKIEALKLVVGDIIVVEAGDRVPADARLIEADNLRVNQAMLTGESVPSAKRATVVSADVSLIDRQNMIYMGTLVIAGQGIAVVTHTGMSSEVGQISSQVSGVKKGANDITKKLAGLGRLLVAAAISLALLTLVVGVLRGLDLPTMSKTALALLVSIIPEGLPVALTATLAVGLLRVFRKRGLIRQITATETLGMVTTICVDKTGTLTEGQLMIEKIVVGKEVYEVTGRGFGLSGNFKKSSESVSPHKEPLLSFALEQVALATTAQVGRLDLKQDEARELTDPTETALAVAAAKAGYYSSDLQKRFPDVMEIPFDQDLRYSASVYRLPNRWRYLVKGSPEKILALSKRLLRSQSRSEPISKDKRQELNSTAEDYARQGYRIVAMAHLDRPLSEEPSPQKIKDLTFVAFFVMSDPIRQGVEPAIDRAYQAGIRPVMITGDHLLTAEHIADKLGLNATGESALAQEVNFKDLKSISVIARATPKEKLAIVKALQKEGEVVAMTGDGVNDAPALKKSDIGIAMGRHGTDVAIEAADMVLLDNHFSSIVAAIEQGRLIWENIRKVTYYLIATSFGEVLIISAALVIGWELPVLAVQILWLNLVTDGITSLALTAEPEEEALMKRPPRSSREPLLNRTTLARILAVSLTMAVASLVIFALFHQQDLTYARSAVLTTMVLAQLFNLFNARSETRSVFELKLNGNPLLLGLFALAFSIYFVALYWPPLQSLLGVVALDAKTLVLCGAAAASVLFVDESRKLIVKSLKGWAKLQTASKPL